MSGSIAAKYLKPIAIFLLFLGATIFWFWKESIGSNLFCYRDLTYSLYPFRFYMVEQVRAGTIPFWNPYLFFGYPFLALMSTACFYPLSALFYLLPFDLAFNWHILIHFPLAAFFMYLLCRELGLSEAASFAAGLAYAFSGMSVSTIDMPGIIAAQSWLPLVLLSFRRCLLASDRSSYAINLVLTVVFLVILLLCGVPFVLYGAIWTMFIYVVIARFGKWRELGTGLLSLFLAMSFFLALSAFQLFHFLEIISRSARAGGLSFAEAGRFSLLPAQLIGFVNPFAAKQPWLDPGWLKAAYLGMVPLFLSLSALFLSKDRRLWFSLLMLFLLVLIVLGPHSPVPLYYLLYKYVPGFNLLRYPVKFTFLIVLTIAILTGLGVDLLSRKFPKMKYLPLIFVALVFADLYAANRGANFTVRTGDYKVVPKNVRILQKDQALFRRLSLARILHRSYRGGEVEFRDYRKTLSLFRARLAPNQNMLYHIPAVDGYESFVCRDHHQLFRRLFAIDIFNDVQFLNMLNIKYVATSYPLKLKGFVLLNREPDMYPGEEIFLYQNTNVLPRAFLVPRARMLEREKMLDYMISSKFKPDQEVLLETAVADVGGGAETISGGARVLCYGSNHVEIEAVTDSLAFLFLSDWYYPGWKAYLDGEGVEILRANYMFRAVKVPVGKHRVSFVYDPWSFKLGLLVSSISALGMVALLVLVSSGKGRHPLF